MTVTTKTPEGKITLIRVVSLSARSRDHSQGRQKQRKSLWFHCFGRDPHNPYNRLQRSGKNSLLLSKQQSAERNSTCKICRSMRSQFPEQSWQHLTILTITVSMREAGTAPRLQQSRVRPIKEGRRSAGRTFGERWINKYESDWVNTLQRVKESAENAEAVKKKSKAKQV